MSYFQELKNDLSRLAGLQKSLKAQRTKVNRNISDIYLRFEENNTVYDGLRLVPLIRAWSLPKLVVKLGRIERCLIKNRNQIKILVEELDTLKNRQKRRRELEQHWRPG